MKEHRRTPNGGFSLVELMVVTAIMAILASVAVPAYINHINRMRQGDASGQLLTARLEMEEWRLDNGRFASTITCLPSFGNACGVNTRLSGNYTFRVENATTAQYYRIGATRRIYPWAPTDRVFISANTSNPTVANTAALSFSLVQWLFQ